MNPNSDDSTVSAEIPDDTVWPPPPTGPRVVAHPRPRLLFVLSVPEVLAEFRLPSWAKSAWNYLFAVFVISWLHTKSPTLAKVVLGFLVLGIGMLFLDFFLGAGIILYARAASAVTGKVHTPANRDSKDFTPGAWLKISPRLMFFVWGLSVLLSSQRPIITWIALIFWVCLLVVGIGIAVVNRVQQWLLNRQQSAS